MQLERQWLLSCGDTVPMLEQGRPDALPWRPRMCPTCGRLRDVVPGRKLVCVECGGDFELSARNVRAARARGEEPRCMFCRRPPRPVTEADRRYWIERFTLDEIRAMAGAIWPSG